MGQVRFHSKASYVFFFQKSFTRVINAGKEGNVTHILEEGEFKKGLVEEDDCVDVHKYGDNLYEQSPSPLFSVFGLPLLSRGFSGLGGAIENVGTTKGGGG